MNCHDVAKILDDHHEVILASSELDEVEHHLAACPDCDAAWRSSHVLRSLGEAPASSPRPDLFRESIEFATRHSRHSTQKKSFWRGAVVGGALAASVALIVGLSLFSSLPPNAPAGAPSVTMSLNEVRDVRVEIESPEALSDARIRVLLVGGIGLDRFEDRSVIDWRTDLDAGVNHLTLPVVALDRTGGELFVEVEHNRKRKVFAVHVDVGDPDYVKTAEPGAVPSV